MDIIFSGYWHLQRTAVHDKDSYICVEKRFPSEDTHKSRTLDTQEYGRWEIEILGAEVDVSQITYLEYYCSEKKWSENVSLGILPTYPVACQTGLPSFRIPLSVTHTTSDLELWYATQTNINSDISH